MADTPRLPDDRPDDDDGRHDEFELTAPPLIQVEFPPGHRYTRADLRALRQSDEARRRQARQFAMRGRFGPGPGDAICRDCVFFERHAGNTRAYSKCRRYGVSGSSATDWSGKWLACGIYEAKP